MLQKGCKLFWIATEQFLGDFAQNFAHIVIAPLFVQLACDYCYKKVANLFCHCAIFGRFCPEFCAHCNCTTFCTNRFKNSQKVCENGLKIALYSVIWKNSQNVSENGLKAIHMLPSKKTPKKFVKIHWFGSGVWRYLYRSII